MNRRTLIVVALVSLLAATLPISRASAQPFCAPDWDRNHALEVQDIFAYLNDWFAIRGDYNHDGVTQVQDIFDFLNGWFQGCPPTDVEIDLTAAPSATQVLPGPLTNGWSYSAAAVKGHAGMITPVAGSYLGPILSFWKGQNASIHFHNHIGQPSIIHWHGMDVPAAMDGYPTATIADNTMYDYAFAINNRAGTYWYHPHSNMTTREEAYAGLAGYFIVHDEEEAALNLPSGAYDLPVCIQDTTFDANNQRLYGANVNGFFGNRILVDGYPDLVYPTATRIYRLRLLNGSVSRIYKLAFSDGTPMVVIGTDGGLLDTPRTYPYVILSPGERTEVWADFSNKTVGTQIVLKSLAFANTGGQGAALDVMTFNINRAEAETRTLPATLSTIPHYQLADAVNAASPKVYAISSMMMGSQLMFTINGDMFAPGMVAPNEVATCNTLEVITMTNSTGLSIIPHPMHFHGRQFQILDRSVGASGLTNWNTVKDGLIDAGWKDTFLIMPQETVRLLVRHSSYPGMYVYHCHNLHHEDMDMMRNFRLDP
jgi:FtsP/CotA-like multicopper oxidase with cupredoxin domain